MKNFLFVLIIFSVIALNCQNSTEPAHEPELANVFRIDLQGGFSHTPVKVLVDNSRVFSDTVTTGYIIACAAAFSPQVFKGTHLLSVSVADTVKKDTTFTITDSLYIGVNYSSSINNISFYFSRKPFYYR